MGKGFEINKSKPNPISHRIQKTQVDDTQKVSFNFKNLFCEHPKFCYSTREKEYFQKLLTRLKDVSLLTRHELQTNHSKTLRVHPINFQEQRVTENGFHLVGVADDDAWQISISANEHGRIHGYFVDNTFFVVWLDPDHKLYS